MSGEAPKRASRGSESGESDQSGAVSARVHVGVSALAGTVAAVVAVFFGWGRLAPLIGWDVAAVVFVVWVGASVLPMDEKRTAYLASREDPGRATASALLLVASVVSLLAVGYVLVQASDAKGAFQDFLVGLAVVSVVLSWCVVHILFMLRYARLYYAAPEGGIDFNGEEAPNYMDFAYLAFTIGMTFQVSDTSLQTRAIRATALHHALLSYLFGTAIVATAINLLAGLSK